jgi:hypothetical protein
LLRPVAFITTSPNSATYVTHSFAATKRSDLLTSINSLVKGTSLNTAWGTTLKALSTAAATSTNINFVTDADTNALGKTDAVRLGAYLNSALALTYVAPGAPMLFSGQEVAYAKVLKKFDADAIAWPTKAHATTALLTKLGKLRTSNPVITSGASTTLVSSLKTVFGFKRSGPSGTVYYLANLTAKAATAKITFGAKGSVYDFATGKKVTIAASQNVTIPAAGYLIYSTSQVK